MSEDVTLIAEECNSFMRTGVAPPRVLVAAWDDRLTVIRES